MGTLHFFLGVEAIRLPIGLFLSQQRYIVDLLQHLHLEDVKPAPTPMNASCKLSKHLGDPLPNPTEYICTIGALQYDIAFCVNKGCQFMSAPTIEHWQDVKRILRYLKDAVHFGLCITSSHSPHLHAFTDADRAGCPDDHKSQGGYCIFFGNNLISWSSKKQHIVSRSSTEAEYRSVAVATAELLWIQSLLKELAIPSTAPWSFGVTTLVLRTSLPTSPPCPYQACGDRCSFCS
ncbi:PREDICTED: uncharacterized protein LOC109115952 [Nelumbo nucifera]|uniref:Uncharacterized protein LOC109115952 n=1 Tax=Nelumbo nucifera TaxID=4432 RepID=A0A1U8QC45_NELNU|nr:PREDICTED: uncharacterized protein LOC109115952 [Nelumbo nucifera]